MGVSSVFRKADAVFSRALKAIGVFCFIGLFFLIGAGVFVRFVPIASMGWADEIIELGFAWMVFLGAALLIRNKSLFRVDFLSRMVAETPLGPAWDIFITLLALVFFLLVTYQGFELARNATDPSAILAIPRYLWYLSVPSAGVVMVGYTIRDLWHLFQKKPLEEKN